MASGIITADVLRNEAYTLTLDETRTVLDSMKDDLGFLNNLCWLLVQAFEAKKLKEPEILQLGEQYLEKAISSEQPNAWPTGTLAHLQFFQGRIDTAITTQKAAVALAPESDVEQFRANLKKFEDAKK